MEIIIKKVVLPDCRPTYYGLTHSLGGLVALRAAAEGRSRFARMVLVAPLIGFGDMRPSEPFARRLAPIMVALGLGEIRVPGQSGLTPARIPFEGNPLTGDADRFARDQALARALPQLFVGVPTFGWFNAAFTATHDAREPDFAPAINIPSLLVVGALDRVTSVVEMERFVAGMRAGGKVIIAGGLHELLMERNVVREQFLAAFDAFVPHA